MCPACSLCMITLSVPRRCRRRYRCRAYSGLRCWKKKSPTTAAKIIFVLDFHRFAVVHTPLYISRTCTLTMYIIYIGVYHLQYTSYYVATRVQLREPSTKRE